VHELTASCCFVFFLLLLLRSICSYIFSVMLSSLWNLANHDRYQLQPSTPRCNCVDHPADRNPFQKCIKNPIILPSTLNHDRKVRNCQAFLLSCRFVYFTSNAKYLLAFSRRWRGTEMLHSKFAQLRKTCLVPSA